jgi:wyosine [tRNA(Phe)-imidazoG37] synthetase (radical SAM superfamily)
MEFKEAFLEKQRDTSCIREDPPFPERVSIDVTSSCNYRCVMCPHAIQKGHPGNIDHEFCLRILDDAYQLGARMCNLSFHGEPLLNKELEKYVVAAKGIGYPYVFITTNGFLLTPDRGRALLDAGLDSIKVSINAHRESYELVHSVRGYDRVIDNLRAFHDYREAREYPCKIFVSFTAIPAMKGEIELVRDDVREISDDFISPLANNRAGGYGVDCEDDEFAFRHPCSQLFNNVYISSEGYLVTCGQEFYNKGVVADLKTMPLGDAWNCNRFIEFRRDYISKKNIVPGTFCYNCLNNTAYDAAPLTTEGIHIFENDSALEKDVAERMAALEKLASSSQTLQ